MMQETLARKLRVLRAARGITLEEAEELTGVTRETLGALEHGQRSAYTSTLQKIADGYGTTVSALLEEEPELALPKAEAPERGRAEPITAPLVLSAMWDASPAERQRAIKAASEAEVARYLADIDKQVEWAERTLLGPEVEGLGQNQVALVRYMSHLLTLRTEADPNPVPPPSLAEIAALVGPAGATEGWTT